jgi:predicted nucleotidyltransferase
MLNELPPQIYEIRDLILQSVEAEKIYLFGSYAYGTPREDSDYDFYVVLQDGYPMKQREAIDKIHWDICQVRLQKPHLRKPFDILVNDKPLFDELSVLPTLERKIIREGIVLYDRN